MPDRIARVRQRLNALGLHGMFLSAPSSLRYLFGFTGTNGLGLITSDLSYFATDWRYRDQAQEEVRDAELLVAQRDLVGAIKERKPLAENAKAGIEEHHLTYSVLAQIRKHFPKIEFKLTDHLLGKLAAEKSPEEILLIKKAAQLTTVVWERLLPQLRAGATEADVSAELNYLARKCGSQIEPFEPIVAAGPRSALPHARSSSRALQLGDVVVIDFGCVVEGYAADFTRTIAMGEPNKKLREAYRAVKAAAELVFAAARAPMKAIDLDAVARKHFEAHGLATYFNHSLGHGLGLDVHSLPRIGPESKDTIPVNAVVAIEPGLYFPGLGGIRLEDDVLITATGCEVLTTASRELICFE
jgi:Xaa-Pro aminopeptidase